ncbi:hypothetical protein M3F36_016680 [Clostridioides difficile]|uniref:hypothetical protein n=2 Tax=Clostridioides difficile TaxID=1496 RepID=UPI000BB19C38|nr:hypothetical protein [Clostridioides difficile]EKS6785874.1 hypothetical protein [Clostridioides difficile]MCJ0144828.1 hypothetical protein [Clostridioides difficile]MCL6802007.1 hypothetical protein [Clostridioides difficile]MDB0503234.1 hypothetical protein [Clostridioides difficile]MDB3405400.1 hypothetical protein [Clostridioides difficile]
MRWRNILVTSVLVMGSSIHIFANTKEISTSRMDKNIVADTAKNINLMYKYEWEQHKNSSEYKLEIKRINLEKDLGIKIEKLIPVTWEVSYYTSLNCENSEYGAITATGEKLQYGFVANNHLKFGTKILVDGNLKVVKDRGSNKYFGNSNAIDVFVPKLEGESDYKYYKRVNNMGRHYKEGYIIVEG